MSSAEKMEAGSSGGKLVSGENVFQDDFGCSVAVSGDTAIVGNPNWAVPGSAYVFSTPVDTADFLAVSPDPDGQGHHLYQLSAHGKISVFNRDNVTGMVTFAHSIFDPVNLSGADFIKFSPSGDFAYMATDLGVAVYSRDAASGELTFVQTLDPAEAGRPIAIEIAPKPDSQGWFVHVAGDSGYLTTYDCSAMSHEITGDPVPVALPTALALSPEGGTLYVGSRAIGAISVFARNPSTGQLTFLERIRNGVKRTRGLDDVAALVVGHDHVFAISTRRDSLVAFLRDEKGQLTCIQRLGSRDVPGLENPNSLALSPDGTRLYVGSNGAGSDARGGIAVFERLPDESPATQLTIGFQSVEALTVTTGGGDDYVRQLRPPRYEAPGEVERFVTATINTGAGRDTVDIEMCGGTTAVNSGDEADDITIRCEQGLLSGTVNAGAGDDSVAVLHSGIEGTWEIYADHEEGLLVGGGDDRVILSTLGDGAFIATGSGADSVVLLRLGEETTVETGDDDDAVEIRSDDANTTLDVDTGGGADYVEIKRTGTGATTNIRTGNGTDVIRAHGPQLNSDVAVHGGDPDASPGDTIIFVAGLTTPEGSPVTPNGSVNVRGKSAVVYLDAEDLRIIALSEADAGSYSPVPEGSPLALSAAASEIPPGRTVRYDWDLDGDGVYGDRTGVSVTLTWADLLGLGLGDDGAYTVSVRLTDVTEPSPSDPASNELIGQETFAYSIVTVHNVAPVVAAVAATPTVENSRTTLSGVISDPGTWDTFTLRVDWGDGTDPESFFYPVGTVSFQETHQYLDDRVYQIQVQVADDDGDVASSSRSLTVSNVAPTVEAGPDAVVDEGSTFMGSVSFTDPGSDTWTATVDYGDGSEPETVLLADKSLTLRHLYEDDGSYTVIVTVADDDTGVGSETLTVTVGNLAPVVTGLSLNETTIDENGTVELSGSFRDEGARDTHTVQINWGDGTHALATLDQTTRTFSDMHRYLDDRPGGYPISVTVTDSDGGQGRAATSVLVTNLTPTVGTDAATVTVVESETATNSGSFDDAGTDTVTMTASIGAITQHNGRWNWSYTPADGPTDGQTVTITANDHEGGMTTTTFALVVQNAAPQLSDLILTDTPGDDNATVNSIEENGTVYLSGRFTDLGRADTHELVIDWGDGKTSAGVVDQVLDTYTANHQYLDDSPDEYIISVIVTDDDGDQDTATASIDVINVAPSPGIAGPNQGWEGSRVSLVAYATDPGQYDPITLTWRVTKDGIPCCDGVGARIEFTPYDEGDYYVSLRAHDDVVESPATTVMVTVLNQAPTMTVGYGTVIVNESSVATNTGSFDDLGNDTLVMTASIGTVDQDDSTKTWSWSYTPADGPSDSRTVTVTADDQKVGWPLPRSIWWF